MIVHKEKLSKSLGYPGSTVARENGCRCHSLRNLEGSGIATDFGVVFVTDPECPLHGVDALFPRGRRQA
jgi:hypothetical protein